MRKGLKYKNSREFLNTRIILCINVIYNKNISIIKGKNMCFILISEKLPHLSLCLF